MSEYLCDTCVYNPPSSCDGKPCCFCNPDDPSSVFFAYHKKEEDDNGASDL